jgi:hypothetical protein
MTDDLNNSVSNSGTDPSDTVPEASLRRDAMSSENRVKRFTIDLTPAAASEVGRIKDMFGLTMADVFRFALTLMRIYADAVAERKEVRIVDPRTPRRIRIVELGILPAMTHPRAQNNG